MFEIIPNYHPFFVHFTVALISVSFVTGILGRVLSHNTLKTEMEVVSRWCLWLGTLSAFATVGAGFYAYYTITHDEISHAVMKVHRNWALVTLSILLCACVLSVKSYMKKLASPWVYLISLFIATIFVLITAWFGGELVYRYGSGVISLPQPDNHQHSAATAHGDSNTPDTAAEENHSASQQDHHA